MDYLNDLLKDFFTGNDWKDTVRSENEDISSYYENEIRKLEEENNSLRETLKRLLDSHDKSNTVLREKIKEINTLKKKITEPDEKDLEIAELKKQVKRLQTTQIEGGDLVRQNMAYGKAFGEILKAIEICKGEM